VLNSFKERWKISSVTERYDVLIHLDVCFQKLKVAYMHLFMVILKKLRNNISISYVPQ